MTGCHKVDPTENMFPLGGTWTGTATESRVKLGSPLLVLQPTVTFNIVQNDLALSGTWSITYANSSYNGAGTLTGSAKVVEDGYYNVVNQWVHTGWQTWFDVSLKSTTAGYPDLSTVTWIVYKENPNITYGSYKGGRVDGDGEINGSVTLNRH
jgi:hypothetical protein